MTSRYGHLDHSTLQSALAVLNARLPVTLKHAQNLGIPDASFHTLRHTAASWLVMEGVDLYAIGQILGHKTPRMTQRYAHLSPAYMAGAVSKMDGIMSGTLATSV